MNPQGDDKELKAAFAEFKELLKRESEPVGPTFAPEIRLEPRAGADTPPRPQDKPANGGMTEAWAALRAASPQPSETDDGDEAVYEALNKPILAADAEQTRRRRLLYLSVAIICAGLAGLGGTLMKNPGAAPEPAIADIAPPEAMTEQAAVEPPASAEVDDAAPATAETPAPALKAEVEPASEAPAPKPAAAAATLPLPGVPPVKDAAPAPSAAKADVAPQRVAAPPTAAAPAAPAASGFSQTSPKTSTAALQPATRAVEPAAPAPADPKPAAKVAKPKPKPAAPQTVAKPHKPGTASPSPAAVADKVEPPPPQIPAPAPVAPPPPPPPPSDNGGAFGFVKRTVNSVGSTVTSVGSTIGDLGRSVIP